MGKLIMEHQYFTTHLNTLKLDGTLLSILVLKSRCPEGHVSRYKWNPEDKVIAKAKSATVKKLKKEKYNEQNNIRR